jgi:hypothetical protein
MPTQRDGSMSYKQLAWAGTGTGAMSGLAPIGAIPNWSTLPDQWWARVRISDASGRWEESIGQWTLSSTTLTRVVVINSSDADALVAFPGAAIVMLLDAWPPAGDVVVYAQMNWAGTGTGTMSGLTAPGGGIRDFSALTTGTKCTIRIEASAGNWEVSKGVWTLSGTVMTRAFVLASSNGGALVSFPGACTVQLVDIQQ